MIAVTPELILRAYRSGIFPMAESRTSPTLFWVEPDFRGVLPLETFHLPRRLKRTIRQTPFEVTVDRDFRGVMLACAAAAPGRRDTWINETILALYTELHKFGHAHSIETWEGEALVGGLYGVSIGGAFFGESMFSRRTDASKIALVHLVARLKEGGFELLDTQFVTEHLKQFGTIEIPRADYQERLARALRADADFFRLPRNAGPDAVLAAASP